MVPRIMIPPGTLFTMLIAASSSQNNTSRKLEVPRKELKTGCEVDAVIDNAPGNNLGRGWGTLEVN